MHMPVLQLLSCCTLYPPTPKQFDVSDYAGELGQLQVVGTERVLQRLRDNWRLMAG